MKETRKRGNGGLKISSQGQGGRGAVGLFVFHTSPVRGDCPCGKRLPYHQRADRYCTTTTLCPSCYISTSLISCFFFSFFLTVVCHFFLVCCCWSYSLSYYWSVSNHFSSLFRECLLFCPSVLYDTHTHMLSPFLLCCIRVIWPPFTPSD